MKRALAALVLAAAATGCLSMGKSPLAPVDETPPTAVRMKPNLMVPLVLPDGGADVYEIPVAGSIDITFSEGMDPDSLRAGIAVRNKGLEIPLTIVAPPNTANPTDADREETVTVSAAGGSGFPLGVSRLVLKTLLIDQQGNVITLEGDQPEVIYFFNVR